jgi:hypothetical protein
MTNNIKTEQVPDRRQLIDEGLDNIASMLGYPAKSFPALVERCVILTQKWEYHFGDTYRGHYSGAFFGLALAKKLLEWRKKDEARERNAKSVSIMNEIKEEANRG